jgi:hypothetical protein
MVGDRQIKLSGLGSDRLGVATSMRTMATWAEHSSDYGHT